MIDRDDTRLACGPESGGWTSRDRARKQGARPWRVPDFKIELRKPYRPLRVATRRAPELGGMVSESGGMAGNQFIVSLLRSRTPPVCLGCVAILIQYAGQWLRNPGHRIRPPAGGAWRSRPLGRQAQLPPRPDGPRPAHRPAGVAMRRRTSRALGEDGRPPTTYGHAGTQAAL